MNKTYIYLINEMKIFIKNLESDKNSNQGFNNDSLIKSLREAINFLQNNEPKMYAKGWDSPRIVLFSILRKLDFLIFEKSFFSTPKDKRKMQVQSDNYSSNGLIKIYTKTRENFQYNATLAIIDYGDNNRNPQGIYYHWMRNRIGNLKEKKPRIYIKPRSERHRNNESGTAKPDAKGGRNIEFELYINPYALSRSERFEVIDRIIEILRSYGSENLEILAESLVDCQ